MAAVAPAADPEVVIIDSDGEEEVVVPQPSGSGRGAGPSQPVPVPGQRRGGQQQQQQRRRSGAGGSSTAAAEDVIDLTGSSPPEDVQIVRSTVQRAPMRGVKRPRPALAPPPQLSPMKQLLLQQLRAPPPQPPPQPEPEGPKCGICMEPMGGSNERAMASGNCGHVYCHDCLVEAVRAQKKCPTCRKTMQVRQIHKVFLQLS